MLSLDSDISNRPGTLDFEANASAAQTVTLNAHHDADIFDDGDNSASLESALDSLYGAKRVDIESIPSPDGDEETNLRIRCVAPSGQHCTRTRFACFDDDGTRHEGDLGRIPRLTVRHLQTSELADLIDHRWEGMGLSCELRSDNDFTVQVMTRTGGGGALVNNSATGVVEE